ncbi:MAG: hypothetical protein WAZ77_01130 [Candidatus Nitrosopolaris sp.]
MYSKIIFGKSHYEGGKKYCRRCEVYFFHDGSFCPCCGMALRVSPSSRRDKDKLREEQRDTQGLKRHNDVTRPT